MSLLVTNALKVLRPHAAPLEYPAFSLKEGEHRLLVGPSGSGKSTLLSVIAGLLPPAEGNVEFLDKTIYDLSSRERDRLRGEKIGFVFQNLHLIPSLTLRQNIALAMPAGTDSRRLDDLLSSLRLKELQDRRPHKLSQGEKQRAAIARAVINRPSLIIADEPTSALDDDNAFAVIEILQNCARETGAALLIATHDNRLHRFISSSISLANDRKAAA